MHIIILVGPVAYIRNNFGERRGAYEKKNKYLINIIN